MPVSTGKTGSAVITRHVLQTVLIVLCSILAAPRQAATQVGVEKQIRTSFDNAWDAHQRGEFVRAESEYRQALVLSLSRMGAIAARLGDYPTAERAFGECVQAVAVSKEGLMGLGATYLRSGQYDKGVEAVQNLLHLDPSNAEARRLLGKIYLMQKKYLEAAEALKAVNYIKEDVSTSYALALAYLHLGRLAEVRTLFDRLPLLAGDTPNLHLLFGRAYRSLKLANLAREEFRKALALDPKLPRAHYFIGLTYLSKEVEPDLDRALQEFSKEIELNPNEFPSHYYIGAIYARQRQFEPAVRSLRRAIALAPTNVKAHHTLGITLLAAARLEEAVSELRRALELAGDQVEEYERANMQYELGLALRRAGRMEEAQRELKLAQEMRLRLFEEDRQKLNGAPLETMGEATVQVLDKPEEASLELIDPPLESSERKRLSSAQPRFANLAATAYNGLALMEASKPDFAKAVIHFRLAEQWDDSIPDILYNLGLAYFRQQQIQEAIPVLEKALAKNPSKIDSKRLLGAARFISKDYAGAAELLAAVVGDAPEKDPKTSLSLALSLVQLNRIEEALVIVERLVVAAPGMAELYVLKGQILARRGENAKAIQSFDTALSLTPSLPDVNFFIGMAHLRQSEFDQALESFNRELGRDRNHVQSKFQIASIAITRNEMGRAVPLLEEVVRMSPRHAEALYELGRIQLEEGNLPPAVANLETAASLEPQKPDIFYQLYRAYVAVGRPEEADLALKRYKALKDR